MTKQRRMSIDGYLAWARSISPLKVFRTTENWLGTWSTMLGKSIHSIKQPSSDPVWYINDKNLNS
jgi:hypothetical protein